MTTAIDAPPDAVQIHDWYDRDGRPVRDFTGPSWSLPTDAGEITEVSTPQAISRNYAAI